MIDFNYVELINLLNMLYDIYPYPAHIQDTLYILTVEMECPGWCAGDAGVGWFCYLLGTHSIYGAKKKSREIGYVTGIQ